MKLLGPNMPLRHRQDAPPFVVHPRLILQVTFAKQTHRHWEPSILVRRPTVLVLHCQVSAQTVRSTSSSSSARGKETSSDRNGGRMAQATDHTDRFVDETFLPHLTPLNSCAKSWLACVFRSLDSPPNFTPSLSPSQSLWLSVHNLIDPFRGRQKLIVAGSAKTFLPPLEGFVWSVATRKASSPFLVH